MLFCLRGLPCLTGFRQVHDCAICFTRFCSSFVWVPRPICLCFDPSIFVLFRLFFPLGYGSFLPRESIEKFAGTAFKPLEREAGPNGRKKRGKNRILPRNAAEGRRVPRDGDTVLVAKQ